MDVMKKSKNIGLLMILLAFFSSCEKYDMVEFGESGEINFRGRYLNGSKYYWSDDEKYFPDDLWRYFHNQEVPLWEI